LSYIKKEQFYTWPKRNIPFVPQKQHYYNNVISDRLLVAELLGFCIKGQNRIIGKRTVNYENHSDQVELQYIHLDNEEILWKNRKPSGTKYVFASELIRNHFNCQTSSSKVRSIKNCPDKKLGKELNKINKVCAFSRKSYNDCIAIDIDNHNNSSEQVINAVHYIVDNYFSSIIYAEVSITGSYHIFLKLKRPYNNSQLIQFQTVLQNIHPNIEIIGSTNKKQLLQYIDSPTYVPIQFDKNKFIKVITETEYNHNIFNFVPEIDSIQHLIPKHDFVFNQYQEDLIEESIPIFGNRKHSKKKDNSNIIEKLKTKYPYYSGQRVEYMKKIAGVCKNYGLTKEQFLEIILSNDMGSKDLSKWNKKKIEKIYFDYYENPNYYTNSSLKPYKQEEKFYSNRHLISDIYLKSIINKFSQDYTNIYVKSLKYKSWKQEYKKVIPILIEEIIGVIIYDYYNPKQKNKKSNLTMNKFNQIVSGFQISNKWKKMFKEHYNVKIDINNVTNSILKNTIFKQIMINNIVYCYNPNYSYSRIWKLNIRFNTNIIKNIIKNIKKIINYNNHIFYMDIMLKVSDSQNYEFGVKLKNFEESQNFT